MASLHLHPLSSLFSSFVTKYLRYKDEQRHYTTRISISVVKIMDSAIFQSAVPEQKANLCTDPHCPSTEPHNAGYYNFTLYYNDELLGFNSIPVDVLIALGDVWEGCGQKYPEYDLDIVEFLAKFAVAHHSHLPALMPRQVIM